MDSSRGFLLALIATLFVLSFLLVLPFVEYFLLAVVLAYVLAPLQRTLEPRVGARITAGALVAATTVAILLPHVVVSRAVAEDATELIEAISDDGQSIAAVEARLEEVTGFEFEFAAIVGRLVGDGGTGAFGSLLDVFGAVTHAVIGLGLTIFLLYYFLKDGDRFLAWLRWVLPLPERVQNHLFEAIDEITWAVLAVHVFVAVVQGVVGGLGLLAVGIPNALFWTVVMVVLALLPIVGSFLVWGPAAVYLAVVDRPVAALFLAAWGTVVVGLSDNYLRPVVVDRYARVNPTVVILGVVGGLSVMGFIGIFVGPVVIGALRATLDVYREEYDPVIEG